MSSKPKSLKNLSDPNFEKFDVNLVKCCEPILIGDKSLTAEDNKVGIRQTYIILLEGAIFF